MYFLLCLLFVWSSGTIVIFVCRSRDPRYLHVPTPSFPTRRSSDLTVGVDGPNSGVYDSKKPVGSDAAVENVHKVADRLARGEFDLVGVGRAIMHDPEWTRRIREGDELLPFDEGSPLVLTLIGPREERIMGELLTGRAAVGTGPGAGIGRGIGVGPAPGGRAGEV